MFGYRSVILAAAFFSGQAFAQPISTQKTHVPSESVHCDEFLKGSAAFYADLAEKARGSFAAKRPKFVTLKEDREIAKSWKGELGPPVLQAFLPEGVSFINHELKNNESRGVVKLMQQSGEYLGLRVDMEFEGRRIGLNIVVSAFALAENLKRALAGEKIYLVGPSVAGAILWGHGGGTNTSNASTVDTLMNTLSSSNVASVGIDAPLHGEGPRELFKDAAQFFRFLVAFRNKFIHPDVPVFNVGHSKGGLEADMAFRRFDRADIGLSDAFRGYIPISYVPDDAPGASFEDRSKAEERLKAFYARPEFQKLDVDGDLGRLLTKAGKTSIMCEIQCLFLMQENDWTLRPNPAVTYRSTGRPIKSLYLIGDLDRLNQGHEEEVKKYLLPLPNTELVTMGVRVSRDGNLMPVGHIVFDHLMPREHSEEADRMIREWMVLRSLENHSKSQAELTEIFRAQMVRPFVSEYSLNSKNNNLPSTLLLAAYFYNDDFKGFIEQRIKMGADFSRVGSLDEDGDAFTEEDALDAARKKYLVQFGGTEKKKEIYETAELIREFILNTLREDGVPEEKFKEQESTTELKVLKFYANTFVKREFLPTIYVHRDVANEKFVTLNKIIKRYQNQVRTINASKQTDQEKLEAIAALETPIDSAGNNLSHEEAEGLRQIAIEIQHAKNLGEPKEKKVIEDGIKKIFENTTKLAKDIKRWDFKLKKILSQDHPEEVAEMSTKLTEQENKLNLDRELVSKVLETRLRESSMRGLNFVDAVDALDEDMWNKASFWHEEVNQFAIAQAEWDRAKMSAVYAGKYGKKAIELAQKLYDKDGALVQLEIEKHNMEKQMEKLRDFNRAREEEKKLAFSQPRLAEYFRYESTSVWDYLQDVEGLRDSARMTELISLFGKTLSQFNAEVWGNRPPPAKTTLY